MELINIHKYAVVALAFGEAAISLYVCSFGLVSALIQV